jgi:hypothetical protein
MARPKRTAARRPDPLRRLTIALDERRLLRVVRILTALIIATALILGYVGLWQYLSGKVPGATWGNTWDDILFYDLQLPFLTTAPLQVAGDFPVVLSVARFLAPIGAFMAALAALELVLGEQLRVYLAAHARGHAIVAGEGPVALALARHFNGRTTALGPDGEQDDGAVEQERDEIRKVVLVSASEDTLTQAGHYGILTVRGDPADAATLRDAGVDRAAEIYACAATSTANAAIALRARGIAATHPRKRRLSVYAMVRIALRTRRERRLSVYAMVRIALRTRRERRLSVYAMVSDDELDVMLRARRIGADVDPILRLDFFGIEEIAARKLFDAYPLAQADGCPATIVVVGLGPLGRAVLREAARRRPEPPGTAKVEVVVWQATQQEVNEVTAAFPSIAEKCSLTVTTDLPAADEYTVFVCVDDDDLALREGLRTAQKQAALAGLRGHVVVCMRESSSFADLLAKGTGLLDDVVGRITVFGVIEAACVPATIRDDYIEQIARAIHRHYQQTAEANNGKDTAGNPLDPGSLQPWRKLSADLKAANVDQALSFGSKLDAVGAVVVSESANLPPRFQFKGEQADPQVVEKLAVEEHDRWMKERISQGWQYGEKRDNDLKLHPALLPWAKLPEAQRIKDRNAVRVIPLILREAGFQILRLPPS